MRILHSMKEADLQRQIKEALHANGAQCFKHHGGLYAESGVSDLVCTAPGGRALFLEVKVPGGKPTQLQLSFLSRMAAVGALTGVVSSVSEALSILKSGSFS